MSVRAQEGGQHIGTHLPALLQAKGLHMRSQVLRKHVVPKGFVMGGWGETHDSGLCLQQGMQGGEKSNKNINAKDV